MTDPTSTAIAGRTIGSDGTRGGSPLGVESAGDETTLSGCVEQYRIGPVEEPDYARWETEIAYLLDRQAR
jgi:hypothetical protein